MAELRLNDPALAVNIHNMTNAPVLHDIVALHADTISHLFGFNFCSELYFTGKDNKLDAINLYTFMPEMKGFESLSDIRQAIDTMRRVYVMVFMEDAMKIQDTLFTHTTVVNSYDHLKEYPELAIVHPSKHPILERTTILLSMGLGTPIPVLQFAGTVSFDHLRPSKGYYVVIAEQALGYEKSHGANLPQVLTFEKRTDPFTVLALSDTALQGAMMIHSYILDNLRKL